MQSGVNRDEAAPADEADDPPVYPNEAAMDAKSHLFAAMRAAQERQQDRTGLTLPMLTLRLGPYLPEGRAHQMVNDFATGGADPSLGLVAWWLQMVGCDAVELLRLTDQRRERQAFRNWSGYHDIAPLPDDVEQASRLCHHISEYIHLLLTTVHQRALDQKLRTPLELALRARILDPYQLPLGRWQGRERRDWGRTVRSVARLYSHSDGLLFTTLLNCAAELGYDVVTWLGWLEALVKKEVA